MMCFFYFPWPIRHGHVAGFERHARGQSWSIGNTSCGMLLRSPENCLPHPLSSNHTNAILYFGFSLEHQKLHCGIYCQLVDKSDEVPQRSPLPQGSSRDVSSSANKTKPEFPHLPLNSQGVSAPGSSQKELEPTKRETLKRQLSIALNNVVEEKSAKAKPRGRRPKEQKTETEEGKEDETEKNVKGKKTPRAASTAKSTPPATAGPKKKSRPGTRRGTRKDRRQKNKKKISSQPSQRLPPLPSFARLRSVRLWLRWPRPKPKPKLKLSLQLRRLLQLRRPKVRVARPRTGWIAFQYTPVSFH